MSEEITREELRRANREADALKRSAEAERILRDPAIKAAWDAIEELTVGALAKVSLDGSSKQSDYALKLVRVLQSNHRHRRLFEYYIENGSLVEEMITRREAEAGVARH